MTDFNINNLIRENIKNLSPYKSAREEFNDTNSILLDANENPFSTGYNRYPDPFQRKLKEEIAKQKVVSINNIFLGNGSDEIIDLLIRAFCNPGKDSVLINVPTYAMYEVCAKINDVNIIKINLDKNFQVDINKIFEIETQVKIIFICSPNNPTGNIINKHLIIYLLENFKGLVVVDEAYIDFADEKSLVNEIANYPNLTVLQTFSKARAMAGIRLGMAFTDSNIVNILSKIKYPYNISSLNQKAALNALRNNTDSTIKAITDQEKWIIPQLEKLDIVKIVYPSDANFLLIKFKNHKKIYEFLKNKKIIVRDRSNEPNCEDCLRISIGNPQENKILIKSLLQFEKINKEKI